MSSGQIFVGGTGRSGTTIMGEVLGTHPEIHTYMRELRFVTDPDGLSTLCNALTTNFSPPQARAAVDRFEDFMLKQLTNPSRRPYLGFDFKRTFGPEYTRLVEEFLDRIATKPQKLGDYHLAGGPLENAIAPVARLIERIANTKRKPKIFAPLFPKKRLFLSPRNEVRDGNYFAERAELCKIIGEFVDSLLTEGMAKTGKSIWCEQTPINAMHASFINEIFPKSHMIFMRRDPRGIFASFLNQRWAPDDPKQSLAFLKNLFARWEAEKAILDARGANYLIVRVEELAADPESELARIAAYLGLENVFFGRNLLDAKKLQSWRKQIHPNTLALAEEGLAHEIETQGYGN